MVLVLTTVIVFAVIIILILLSVSILCCCRRRKQTIIISKLLQLVMGIINYRTLKFIEETVTQQDIIPAVSDNPAYRLVTVPSLKEGNAKTQKGVPDYEEIEEIYFKHNTKNSVEGDYEPVECRV